MTDADRLLANWTPDQIARHIREEFEDHERFCAKFQIRDKRGVPVRFRMSPAGRKILARAYEQRRKGKPVRIMVLKPRQAYCSATLATEIFKRTAFLPGQQALVFGHTYDAARNIWGYIDQYQATYNPGESLIRPMELTRRRKDEYLEWGGSSWVDIASAENVQTGRSYSLRHLLLSESAFWRDAATLRTGLLQCVPNDADTCIFDESTANGASGAFFERWNQITSPDYRGDWEAVFFGAHEHPEYQRPLDVSVAAFYRSLTREERDLIERYGLTYEQINWRRWCIANSCDGSVARFKQEYPYSAEEAFLASGRPRFDLVSLGKMPVIPEPSRGEIERVRVGTGYGIQFLSRTDGRGPLSIFRKPERGHHYIIGCDPAEGIDIQEGRGDADPDYSVASVVDVYSGEQVACYHERLEPDAFADVVAAIGEWYNWAFLVPEVNSVGLAFVQGLLYRQYPTHLIYQRDYSGHGKTPMLQELGWKETVATRQLLISTHDRALMQGAIRLHCPICVREHRTFVIKPSGRAEHSDGCHDDAVFANALVSVGLETAIRLFDRMQEQRKRALVRGDYEDEDEDNPAPRSFRYRKRWS